MFKRNQVMITALAIMIAVAGYLNFAGTKIEEEELVSADAAVSDGELTALLDLSQEDIAADIYSLDPAGEELAVENFLDEDMQLLDTSRISVASELVDEEEAEGLTDTGMDVSVQDAEVLDGETPGEAVYTSSAGLSVLSGARLL